MALCIAEVNGGSMDGDFVKVELGVQSYDSSLGGRKGKN